MSFGAAKVFGEIGHVLGLCPHCASLFYLSEARPYLAGKQPHTIVDELRAQERRLDRAEERLNEIEATLREKAADAGLRAAKRALKRIDRMFSGGGYNPHDVKVIFDPVPYVIFNGMGAGSTREIILLAKPPESTATERLQNSIKQAVKEGNLEFRTLHVDREGKVKTG
jgi:predicted Holliday junction resolvase-like endonuclease